MTAIKHERRGEAIWLTIDRPDRRNALSPAAHRELLEGLDRAATEARVAVISGSGETFCAGSDIESLRDASPAAAETLVDPEFELHRHIESLPVPIIAAVNGPAYGGGVELVAVCDLAVAVDDATFALPETRLGLTPGYALDRANDLVGRKRMLELALTGQPIDATTAHEWGFVNDVVPATSLADRVATLVDHIAEAPEHAISAVKRTVSEDATVDVSYQRSVDRLSALLAAPETQTRLSAFLGNDESEE